MKVGFTIIHHVKTDHPYKEVAQQHIRYVAPDNQHCSDFYYSTNDKFPDDKVFTESDHFILGLDGAILNLLELKNAYQISSKERLLIHLFEKHQTQLPNHLSGEFCGFVFDKNKQKLFVFTNHTGSRKLYYTHLNETVVISSELKSVANFYKSTDTKPSLNRFAAYQLLTFAGMLDNHTLIHGCKRLIPGEYLLIQQGKTEIDKYQDYNNVTLSEKSESDLIGKLDSIFKSALIQQLEKDRAYDYQHIGTLSGGLDSRMVVMKAHELGYPMQSFCFSQSDYHDEKIARQIATDLGTELQFVPLDSASHLFDYDKNLNAYDGLTFYLNSAHFAYGLKQLDLKPYGLIHTGLIGDALLGSGLTYDRVAPPQIKKKLMSKMLYFKIQKEATELARKFASDDSFSLYNRLLNVTIAGTYICAPYSYHATPFMHPDFVAFSMSIPPSIKYNQRIYLNWVNQCHKDITRYKWERTRMRPTSHWKTQLSRYTKKSEQIMRRLTGSMHRFTMTPYAYWYAKNEKIKPFFNQLYKQHEHVLSNDPELAADAAALFTEGNVPEKSMVLTLLGAMDMLGLES